MSIGFLYPPVTVLETEQTITNLSPESDSEDEDYVPSPSDHLSSSSSSEIPDMDKDTEIDPAEATSLQTETSSLTWPTWEERDQKEKAEIYATALADLEAREANAASIYNPNEVISLIHEFYTLLIEMGYWPTGCLKPGPHTLDTELLHKLGYTDSAIYILTNLPYIDSAAQTHDSRVLRDTVFVDYTVESDLLTARHPDHPWNNWDNVHLRHEWEGFVVGGEMVTLAWIGSRDGEFLVLDTSNGLLRNYSFMDGMDTDIMEYKRFGPLPDDDHLVNPTDFRRCKFITAADWFRNAIYNYRSLRILPFLEYGAEELALLYPQYKDHGVKREIDKFELRRLEEKKALLQLLPECGWDTSSWRRTLFLRKWGLAQILIQKREAEVEKIWYSSDHETRKAQLSEEEYTVAEKDAIYDDKIRKRNEEILERMRKDIEFSRDPREVKKEKMKKWEESVEYQKGERDRKVKGLEDRVGSMVEETQEAEEEVERVTKEIEEGKEVKVEVEHKIENPHWEEKHIEAHKERKEYYLKFFEKWRAEREQVKGDEQLSA